MVAIGLVPELTVEAAKRAALGAGARLVGSFSFELTAADLDELQALKPDLILLAGGTDGGNKTVLRHNGALLAASSLDVPVILAATKPSPSRWRPLSSRRGRFVTGCRTFSRRWTG